MLGGGVAVLVRLWFLIQVTKNQLKPASGNRFELLRHGGIQRLEQCLQGMAPSGPLLACVPLCQLHSRAGISECDPTTSHLHSTHLEISVGRQRLFPDDSSRRPGIAFHCSGLGHLLFSQPVIRSRGICCLDWPALTMWLSAEPRDEVSPTKIA